VNWSAAAATEANIWASDAHSDYHADRFYFPASVEAVAGHLYVAEFKFPNRTLVFSE